MSRTKVKICGLQDARLIESMGGLPIDCLGFVFAKSRRQVTAEQAKLLVDAAKSVGANAPECIGVFVNAEQEQLRTAARTAGLDAVQLHGQETPEYCRQIKKLLPVKVYKVFAVAKLLTEQQVEELLAPYLDTIDGVFIDTYDPVVGGGTGKAFAWECIPPFRTVTRRMDLPLFVAGGLRADNVSRLIEEYEPDAVDVSSGVETAGVKDIEKIRSFVERVKKLG